MTVLRKKNIELLKFSNTSSPNMYGYSFTKNHFELLSDQKKKKTIFQKTAYVIKTA